jgi:hypothetical protein
VADLDPWVVAFGRATVAAALAAVYLLPPRAAPDARRRRARWPSCGAGVIVGFPLLTSLALEVQTAAHGAVVNRDPARGDRGRRTVKRAHVHRAGLLARGRRLVAVLASSSRGRLAAPGRDPFCSATVVLVQRTATRGRRAEPHARRPRTTICWALVLAAPLTASVHGG